MFLSAFNVFGNHHFGGESIGKTKGSQKQGMKSGNFRQTKVLPGQAAKKLNKTMSKQAQPFH
jgi:hypothetical protein